MNSYVKRHAESTVKKLSEMFGAVLVAGPRQVGKTTMLKELTADMNYVSLDDMLVRTAAREESGTFFKDNPPPVFVDEIQKAPELFEQIKIIIDRDRKKGQFYMCGSQQFQMMKGVSESLAGRIGLVTLLGFSLRERCGIMDNTPFLPTDDYFKARKKDLPDISYNEIWSIIHRGSMPELCENPEYDWQMFFGAYVLTYIERDVRDLSEVGDTVKFAQFMTLCRSFHRTAPEYCISGTQCWHQPTDSRTLALHSCRIQHCLPAKALLEQYHKTRSQNTKALFPRHRSCCISDEMEYCGCS